MDANKHIAASEVGGEGLAQAIEDLTVRDTGAIKGEQQKPESARSSPSAMNSLPPINTTGPGTTFSMRTTSPVADSTSPTFGLTAHATSNSSPSTSQVSVGSVGPTLVASLLNQRHHYDLTPVMRNTTSTDVRPLGIKRTSHATGPGVPPQGVVSPETVEEEATDFLHGEHLSLPADLSKTEEDGPILPSLRKSTISAYPPMQRAKSLTAAHLSFSELPPKAAAGVAPSPQTDSCAPLPDPVQFPARKYYSFTSREQYKGLAEENVDEDLSDEESLNEHPDPTPYQPSRQEFAEIEESLPPEALESIFIARRRRNSARENAVIEGVVVRQDEDEDESSHKNHRLLANPIPMTDRQWSIPSLRMGQRLATDGSLASLTDHLDDESLLYVHPGGGGDMTDEDEASLSSRASSLYMSIGGVGVPTTGGGVPTSILEARDDPNKITEGPTIWNDDISSSFSHHRSAGSSSFEGVPSFGSAPPESNNKVIVESPWNLLSGAQSSHSDENSAVAVDGDRASRRKRKQRQREEAALSWIQSLQQQSQPAVAEAASSKFLTGRTQNHAFRKTADDATAFAAISEETPRLS